MLLLVIEIGLRGTQPTPAKQPNEYRVLILGDSFVFGLGVESNQTFAALLERLLAGSTSRPVKVINAGVNSFGTLQELEFLKTRGLSMTPDLVILSYYENDVLDNIDRLICVDGFLQKKPRSSLDIHHSCWNFSSIRSEKQEPPTSRLRKAQRIS